MAQEKFEHYKCFSHGSHLVRVLPWGERIIDNPECPDMKFLTEERWQTKPRHHKRRQHRHDGEFLK